MVEVYIEGGELGLNGVKIGMVVAILCAQYSHKMPREDRFYTFFNAFKGVTSLN